MSGPDRFWSRTVANGARSTTVLLLALASLASFALVPLSSLAATAPVSITGPAHAELDAGTTRPARPAAGYATPRRVRARARVRRRVGALPSATDADGRLVGRRRCRGHGDPTQWSGTRLRAPPPG